MARGEEGWFAYWIQEDPYVHGKLLNCIRGPKSTKEEMIEEVARMAKNPVVPPEYILLKGSLETNKPILRDKLALMHRDAARAMQRFRILSIPSPNKYGNQNA